MAELKEDLSALKKANLKLRNRLQKRDSSNDIIKLTEHYAEVERTMLSELDKLRKELAQIKSQTPSKEVKEVCPARAASRQRIQSERESRERKINNECLLELYSEIDELKFKLNR